MAERSANADISSSTDAQTLSNPACCMSRAEAEQIVGTDLNTVLAKDFSTEFTHGSPSESVTQEIYKIHLPNVVNLWKKQQELCIGPDRPLTLEGKTTFRFTPEKKPNPIREENITRTGKGLMDFINSGFKSTSKGQAPGLMTYVLGDQDGGIFNFAEEGDHLRKSYRKKDFPYLHKNDGRAATKHDSLREGGKVLYAGEMFVDTHVKWSPNNPEEGLESPNRTLVIDDGSGTFTPPQLNLDTIVCVLQAYFPELDVAAHHYTSEALGVAAKGMGLKLDAGNAVKSGDEERAASTEFKFRYPYQMTWHDSNHEIIARDSNFPVAWAVHNGTASPVTGTKDWHFQLTMRDEKVWGGTLNRANKKLLWNGTRTEVWECASPPGVQFPKKEKYKDKVRISCRPVSAL
eukprot:CAMPEP_0172667076 /NCGR_PEP_ID=MMETSP1074-20121228/8197_1 /TAXON_ID=2916 /ORGANISM="Ceratium fusus, Strain PA161109" /LENGTH=403 /DNA_ID=CAMNT_0013483539 /DNA_START=85 /DNA_END=1296 /DNA_ORIENTATION=+